MPKRRKLKRLAITEVSGVSRPAQENARVALFKSADSIDKAAAQTSEAQAHRHNVIITGNGSMGLNLILTEHTGSDGSHTHPIVRTRGGWQIGMAVGHTHTLPDVSRIIARLLETDPASDPEPVGKADTSGHAVVAYTSETQAHQHTIIRRQNGTYALGLGGDPSHTHDITVDGDRVQVAMVEAHVHDIREPMSALVNKSADKQAEIHALLELDNLKNWRKKKEDSNMNDIEKSRLAKAQAETDLDALANRIAKALNLTSEQGMDRALQTAKGQELYNLTVTLVAKAAPVDPLADWCAEQVSAKLAKSVNEYDTIDEVAEKRRQLDREVMDSPEYATKYADIYQPRIPAEPDNPDPLSLRKSGETFQKCVDRLTDERAFHRGVTKAAAYASMARDETLLPLLEKAYSESIQASDSVMHRMTNGSA